MTTHLIIPDQHAHPDFNNKRADWLSKLIIDVKPDVVVNIGDGADMHSLASYDIGKRTFHGRTYSKDIRAHTDFQDRVWNPVRRRKQKLPRTIYCIGNHEQRIEKALDLSPQLVGTIGMGDLELDQWYNEVVYYHGLTPGVIDIDGVTYGHYFISGVMGRSISGEHPAYSIISKQHASATCGHSHVLDYCVRTDIHGKRIMALNAGVYQDYESPWAGEVNQLWWKGVVVKRNVHKGNYDPQFISIETLKKEYG